MNDAQDDPLLGLLTDIAEGVATLAARVDAMEAANAVHQAQVNEALATIAEIATRTYYANKPTSALPSEAINAAVMNPMIERWPTEWMVTVPPTEFKLYKKLDTLSIDEIEAQLRARAVIAEGASNAQRISHARVVLMLQEEMDKRFKAHEQSQERDAPGRSR
jgi:hypothetical protein